LVEICHPCFFREYPLLFDCHGHRPLSFFYLLRSEVQTELFSVGSWSEEEKTYQFLYQEEIHLMRMNAIYEIPCLDEKPDLFKKKEASQ
jgi:hypothetical protein